MIDIEPHNIQLKVRENGMTETNDRRDNRNSTLKNILDSHKQWLNGQGGSKADFTEADLRDADFRKADLRNACFYKADLTGADFTDADLSNADFRLTDLRKACFCKASLREADFFMADLRNADFCWAGMRDAHLVGAKLNGSRFGWARLWYSDFSETDFTGADLVGAELMYSNLAKTDFIGANLTEANLHGASLLKANLKNANLTRANLDLANLAGVKIKGTVFHEASFLLAKNIPNGIPLACPPTGEFIGYKKAVALNGKAVIVCLKIPKDAARLSAGGPKCRCDKAEVIDITSIDGTKKYKEAVSNYDKTFTYRTGEKIHIENFCKDRWSECSSGIHFFVDRKQAVDY